MDPQSSNMCGSRVNCNCWSYCSCIFSFHTFFKTAKLFSKAVVPLYILSSNPVIQFFFASFDKFIVISHCGFNLHLPNGCDVEHLFRVIFLPSVYFLQWNVPLCFFPSFNWLLLFLLLSVENCSCVLDINLLLHVWFASIFSHSVTCLFILFTGCHKAKS